MTGDKVDRQVKSFSLKITNVDKVEKIAYEKKKKQSAVVDEMIEEFEDGNN